MGALLRARPPEALQQVKQLAAAPARLAQRCGRVGEGLLGERVVALTHRALAALGVQSECQAWGRAELLQRLAREALVPRGALMIAAAEQLRRVAQVGVEAVGHHQARYRRWLRAG